jgi:anaerobic magnesium-protoporphyrin IX monomethyl ester cyclase
VRKEDCCTFGCCGFRGRVFLENLDKGGNEVAEIVLIRHTRPHFEINYTHPLGLMYLAAFARERGHRDLAILDNRLEGWSRERLLRWTLEQKPKVVGMTGLTMEASVLYAFSRSLREKAPDVVQVAGGVHATHFTESTLRDSRVDLVVMGEGEETFSSVLDRIRGGGPWADLPGIAFLREGEMVQTDPQQPLQDLDIMPFPAWDLIPVERYFGKPMGDLLFSRPELMSLYTTRSCPFECIYCHNMFGRGFRPRSAENVFEEIRILYDRYGIREFHIQDDIFNLKEERALEICERIVRSGMRCVFAFPNGLRADIMTDDLLTAFKRAGVRRVAYSIESASPRIQNLIRKRLDLDKASRVAEKSAKMGFLTKGFFMLGFPTETREEMEATIRFARDSAFHIVNFSRVLPNRGTELYRMVVATGRKIEYDFDNYRYDYSDINLSAVDDETFEGLIRKAYRSFINRPGRMLQLFRLFPNKRRIFPYYFFLLIIKILARKKPNPSPRGFRG